METTFLHIIVFAGSYLLFFAALLLAKKRGANRLVAEDGSLVCSYRLLWLHLAGLLLFGLLPFCFPTVKRPVFFSLNHWQSLPTLCSLVLFVCTLWLSPRLAKKQIPVQAPGHAGPALSYLACYLLLRVLFIAAYEVWFRGFLLQHSIQALGLFKAIGLNLVLYTLLHLVNDKKEMALCLPFGLLLCVLCVWQAAVWPAVLIHLALTLGYEIAFLRKQLAKTSLYAHSRYRRFGLYRS